MTDVIQELEMEQLAGRPAWDFRPGDTVVVRVRILEGKRERLQKFEGVVIAVRNRGLNASFYRAQNLLWRRGGAGVSDLQPGN